MQATRAADGGRALGLRMRIYYLEEPLSGDDVSFVQEAMEDSSEIQNVRIPHVLPTDLPTWDEMTYRTHSRLLRAALRNSGITSDKGKQILLVAPKALYWYSVLINAVYAETGAYPWLIQACAQREAVGNPGETRILDTHGLMGLKE